MRAAPTLLAVLALAGCGVGVPGRREPTTNDLIRLSTPKQQAPPDPQLAARPQPLSGADLAGEGMAEPACDFSSGGRTLLAATPSDAVARVNGQLLHFNHSSPVGPTGGFLEDRQISFSVGRTEEIAPGAPAAGRWPARLTVTNRRAAVRVELAGAWRCR